MKRVFCVAICCGICTAGGAATKCVALDATKTAVSRTYKLYESDWTVTETDGTVLRGVAVCGTQEVAENSTADEITVGANNLNCWCKLVSPAVSKWVFMWHDGTADGCASDCVYGCSYRAMSNPEFRAAMFGSMQ